MVALACLVGSGCYEVPGTADPGVLPSEAPPPDDTIDLTYPAGPYGVSVGSVLTNYEFVGFPSPEVDTTLVPMRLGDFYNPTGDGVYPEGSPYGAGKPMPKAIVVVVSAVWCAPCNYEADQILPGKLVEYEPKGADFFMQLIDGPNPGTPATETHLAKWTNKYDVDYPATLDPSYQLQALLTGTSFPASLIIDTRTMTLRLARTAGVDESFWAELEAVLGE
jgi:hypothetical protein